jgi:CHASE3 domain sensor protein
LSKELPFVASGPTNSEAVAPAGLLRSMQRPIWALLLAELLLFAAAGYLSFRLVAEARASRAWVEHSHEVLHSLAALRLTISRLSAWTLYYVAGDSPIDGSAFRAEVDRVQGQLDGLRDLVADDTVQRERVVGVAVLLDGRMELHRRLVETVAPGDLAAAQPIARPGSEC